MLDGRSEPGRVAPVHVGNGLAVGYAAQRTGFGVPARTGLTQPGSLGLTQPLSEPGGKGDRLLF